MKRIAILGSTGSVGVQTLQVIRDHPDQLRVVALAANRNGTLLREQAAQFSVSSIALFESDDPTLPGGMDSLLHMVQRDDIDLVVVSVAGVVGLKPTLEAVRCGKHVALASKEVLVAAGSLMMEEVRKAGVLLTPIDSEHSAIFQCMQGYRTEQLSKIILTASGGPFRGKTAADLKNVTLEQALNHPTWKMGGKITVDSATLFNKALELIEARWLFGIPGDRIDVIVHPQSVVHSMVQFKDGSAIGQLGFPDMKLPISYALLYPDRLPSPGTDWSPLDTPSLTFEPLDNRLFPSVELAREVLRRGGAWPAAFNAANEEAANAFLRGKIRFTEIYNVVEATCAQPYPKDLKFDTVFEADMLARQFSRKLMEA